MANNTTSLAAVNATLAAVISSNITAGSSSGSGKNPPVTGKTKIKSVELNQTVIPHAREKWRTDNYSPRDFFCRSLSQVSPVPGAVSRTSHKADITRSYRTSQVALGQRLEHLNMNGFNGTGKESKKLLQKLSDLELVLINRKSMLMDGQYYRACQSNGKSILAGDNAQKTDMTDRLEDFNEFYDRNISVAKHSLFPSSQMSGNGKATLFRYSPGKETHEILQLLEKIQIARQKVQLAGYTEISPSHYCQHLEGIPVPVGFREWFTKNRHQKCTQVAYQSFRDGLTDLGRILEASMSKGAGHSVRIPEMNNLRAALDKLRGALHKREEFLANGEYYSACRRNGGQPFFATDQEQREFIAALGHHFSVVRDTVLSGNKKLLNGEFTASADAYFGHKGKKCPSQWKEARQVASLIDQLKGLEKLVRRYDGTEKERRTGWPFYGFTQTVKSAADQSVTSGWKDPGAGQFLENTASASLKPPSSHETTSPPAIPGIDSKVFSSAQPLTDHSGTQEWVVPVQPSTPGAMMQGGDVTNSPVSFCPQMAPSPVDKAFKEFIELRGGFEKFTQVAYQSLQADLTDFGRVLNRGLSRGRAFNGKELNLLKKGFLGKLTSDLSTREKFLANVHCATVGGQALSEYDREQRETLVWLTYGFAARLDRLRADYSDLLGLQDSGITSSSVQAFWTGAPVKSADDWREADQVNALINQLEQIGSLINDVVSGAGGKVERKNTLMPSPVASTTSPVASTTSPVASTTSTQMVLQRSVILHDVTVLYLKDKDKSSSFPINVLQDRMVHQVDGLIRSVSNGKEGFGNVFPSDWYGIDRNDWAGFFGREHFTDFSPITQVKKQDSFNLGNSDYVVFILDDTETESLSQGRAYRHKENLVVGYRWYGNKSLIEIYVQDGVLDEHCFRQRPDHSYNQPEICYTSPDGKTLTTFDVHLFHEFLHTKGLSHSLAFYCDNVLLGRCSATQFNMFDALSYGQFFGVGVNACDKYQAGWLTDKDIVSLASDSGTHDITLNHLNSDSEGKKAVKIDYQGYSGFDIWLEFRQPGLLDYGLHNKAFDDITSGLLVYKNNQLLDATPETKAINFVDQHNVAITGNFTFDPLGLGISVLGVDLSAQTISFRVDLSTPVPVRNKPVVHSTGCSWLGKCRVAAGESITRRYEAGLNDLGYGNQRNEIWQYKFTNLPAGINLTDSGVKPPVRLTDLDFLETCITFSVGSSVVPDDYRLTLRIQNPHNNAEYRESTEYISVLAQGAENESESDDIC